VDERKEIEDAIMETLLSEVKHVYYKKVNNCVKCSTDCITSETRIEQLKLTMAFNNVNFARKIMIDSDDDNTRPTVSATAIKQI
jgi:hypothetical protein